MTTKEQFALFLRRVEELRQRRIVQSGALRSNLKMEWSAEDGIMKTTAAEPDEEDLRSFLLTFRQFFADKEPVFLQRIFNLCYQRITDDEIKGYVLHARDLWKTALKGNGLHVQFDEVAMTPEYVMDVMINGHYFHNDQAHQQTLKTMFPEWQTVTRFLFLDFLVTASNFIFYLSGVIEHCLKEGLILEDAPSTS